jgi:hypothetical protein
VAAKWATVTIKNPDGRRHSLDVQATNTYDAAHLYVTEAKKERAVGLPKPTLATLFEVVTEGKVYRVKGEALQKWIVERRSGVGRRGTCLPIGHGWRSAGEFLNAAPCADCYEVGQFEILSVLCCVVGLLLSPAQVYRQIGSRRVRRANASPLTIPFGEPGSFGRALLLMCSPVITVLFAETIAILVIVYAGAVMAALGMFLVLSA